ncbi:hypothetical protein [Streptomyces sp. HUAS TT20]|nr:hypothetical protein [Streptomyces sp. HUAS 15-9]UXY32944.1 hypothetical protein N8I87_42255 [Streptomyces sp. HUAS 15-9]
MTAPTGSVRGDLSGCSFWYEQNSHKYKQVLHCQTTIRLGKPLPDDN